MPAPNYNPPTTAGAGGVRVSSLAAHESEIQRCLDALFSDLQGSISAVNNSLTSNVAALNTAIASGDNANVSNSLRQFGHRPGDMFRGFVQGAGGGSTGVQEVNQEGSVVRFSGAATCLSNARIDIQPAPKKYLIDFAVRRFANSSDPANDSVEFCIRFSDRNKTTIETRRLRRRNDLRVSDGRVSYSYIIGHGSGSMDTPGAYYRATVRPPTGARYAQALIIMHGTSATQTDVEVCGIVELPPEPRITFPDLPDIPGLVSDVLPEFPVIEYPPRHLGDYPGDVPDEFDLSAGGTTAGEVALGPDGATVRYSGSAAGLSKLRNRGLVRLEGDERYELRFSIRRHLDGPDPANDAVRFRVRYFNNDKELIGSRVLADEVPRSTDGLVTRRFRVARVASAGIGAWPPGACYAQAAVDIFGGGHKTDVITCGISRLPNVQGLDGPQGPAGADSVVPGPMGPIGSYFGLALTGLSDDIDDRPESATEGDGWGLIVGNSVQVHVWHDGAWLETLSPSLGGGSDGLSLWQLRLEGDGTTGPYGIGWAGPIMVRVGADFLGPSAYTRSGTQLTFTTPVSPGAPVEIILVSAGSGIQAHPIEITGDGTTGPYAVGEDTHVAFLHSSGSFLSPFDDYSVSGGNLTFAEPLASGVKAWGLSMVGMLHRSTPGLYNSRAEAQASSVPVDMDTISVRHRGVLLAYRRDNSGTALATLGGAKWSPTGDTPSPLHYGAPCDDTTDDAPYWYACGLENGKAFGLGQTYTFKSGAAWPRGLHISTIDLTDTTLNLHAIAGYVPAFTIRGSGITPTYGGEGVIATATADLPAKTRVIPIDYADGAAEFEIGDTILIKSGEYWSGVPGVSGYGVQTKGEFATITEVAADEITILTPTRDSYNHAVHPVSIYRMQMLDGVSIRGNNSARIIGLDQDIGGEEGERVQEFPSIATVEFARDVTISGVRTTGFVEAQFLALYCINVDCSENTFRGPEISEENLPEPTVLWSKGLDTISCESVRFVNNHGFRLRTPVDFQSGTNVGAICQNATVTGGTATACWRPWATHMVRSLTVTGQVSRCLQAFYFRGQDATITGNVMTVYTDGDAAHFGLAPINTVHAEEPNVGDIVFSYNVVDCGGADAFRIAGSVRSFTCDGNTFRNVRHGGEIWSKRIGLLSYRNNKVFSREAMDAVATNYGLVVANHPNVPLVELGGADISGNEFVGRWGTGVLLCGTMSGPGAGQVRVSDNRFGSVRLRGVSLRPYADSAYGSNGNYAVSPFVRDNTFDVEPTSLIAQAAGGGPIAVTGAQRMGSAQYIANVGSAAGDPLMNVSYRPGMRDLYAAPAAGGREGRLCMTAGTGGTLAGVTGGITSGQPTLVVNDASNIFVGAYLAVAGAGLAAGTRVIAKAGNTLTLSGNAASTVAGAAVTYAAPAFKGFGAVEA